VPYLCIANNCPTLSTDAHSPLCTPTFAKVSTFREALRSLNDAVAAGTVDKDSMEYDAYARRLMKGPCEHNWGLSIDYTQNQWQHNWSNADFHGADAPGPNKNSDYARHETEWQAQREWMHPCTDATSSTGTLPLTCPRQYPNLGCANITGAWLDGVSGTRNDLTALPDGTVSILPEDPSSWNSATGHVSGRTLTVTFGSAPALLTGALNVACDQILWSNEVTWNRAVVEHRPASPQWNTFVESLEKRLAQLEDPAVAWTPSIAGMGPALTPFEINGSLTKCGRVTVGFSASDGSVDYLLDSNTGRQWVASSTGVRNASRALARFGYQTFSQADFDVWAKEYTSSTDFAKAGMASVSPEGKHWAVELRRGWVHADVAAGGGCRAVMEIGVANATAVENYGAPAVVTIEYTLPGKDGALVDITVLTVNKTSTRLPEAQWLSFVRFKRA
jgi:hypothetical protein